VTEPNLTPGTKYWHIRAAQGDASPTTAAETAWSATGTFVVSSNPTAVTPSVSIASPFGGDTEIVTVQLGAVAPAGGTAVTLTSSNPATAPVPATFTMPAGMAWGTFNLHLGQVTAPTPVTLTESVNGTSASVSQTVQPSSLKSLSIFAPITGGQTTSAVISLNGEAPAGGAVVQLSSSNPAVVPVPASVTVAAGSPTLSFNIPTNSTPTDTSVSVTATWNGVTASAAVKVTATPAQAPSALTLNPSSTTGTQGSTGTVTLAAPAPSDTQISLSSGIPAIASVPASVVIPQGGTSATFAITSVAMPTSTVVTIQASAGGVTRSADLTVLPPAALSASLSSLSVNPASVQGGTPATGTATLSAPAPSGGAVVTLTSNSAVASVPSGITIPAGSTSATFTVTTSTTSSSTSATISASYAGTAQTATVAVTGTAPTSDKVAVTLAEYDVSKKILNAQATSSSTSATMKVYVTSTGALIGTLTNVGGGKYEGKLAEAVNPQNITVTSSLGGSASANTVAK
jgi:hypothetical protein